MYKLKLVFKICKTIYNNLKYPKGAFRTQTSEQKILREKSQRPRAVNFFHKNVPPPILDQTLSAPCTPKLIYYIKLKIKTATSQSAERLQAPWSLFSAKFKAPANELHQEKTQLRCYKDILLTDNCFKIY